VDSIQDSLLEPMLEHQSIMPLISLVREMNERGDVDEFFMT
jgi:hypothetical protein